MTIENTDDAKGRVEEAAGDLTDNEDLQNKGKGHQAEGKLKGAVDRAANAVKDIVDKAEKKTND